MIEGGCLCGQIRYRIDGAFTDASNCHCAMCRKVTGAAFGTFGEVRCTDLHWISGQELIQTYRSSGAVMRTFCKNCGSTLQANYESEPEVSYLALGTVDDDPGCRPKYHIFVGSKACWLDITDNLPQNETWSSGPPGQ